MPTGTVLRTCCFPPARFGRGVAGYLCAGMVALGMFQPAGAQDNGISPGKAALIGAALGGAAAGIIAIVHYGGDRKWEVKPRSLDFGTVAAGASSNKKILVRNRGTETVRITSTVIQGRSFSFVQAPEVPIRLEPGATAEFEVRFAPAAAGAASGVLEIARSRGKKGMKKDKLDLRGRGSV